MAVDLQNFISITVTDSLSLNIEVGLFLLIIALVVLLFSFLRPFRRFKWGYTTELTIQLGGIGTVNIKPNAEVAQIAHQAWVELITRKAGLPFDQENDIIVEVYNSWYQLFGEMRALIKSIPADQVSRKQTMKLVLLLIDALNKGLRPHLTAWQGKFRRWYESEIAKDENKDKTPQEIQQDYSHYDDMIADLIRINQQLVEYTTQIKKLSEF